MGLFKVLLIDLEAAMLTRGKVINQPERLSGEPRKGCDSLLCMEMNMQRLAEMTNPAVRRVTVGQSETSSS